MKINKRNVDDLLPTVGAKVSFHFDDELKGFGVRVSGETKTYIVQRYVDEENAQGATVRKKVRMKLGCHGDITADQARKKASQIINQITVDGVNPKADEARARTRDVTLAQVFEDYKRSRLADGGLRPKTIDVYRSALNRCFGDWLDEPIANITKDQIVERFERIATTEGPRSNKGGAKAQAAQAMRTLKALLSFAGAKYDDAGIEADPVGKLSRLHRGWSKVAKRTDVIDPDDMKTWYAAVIELNNDTMRDYILFCFFTGLRRSAAAKLKWSNINKKSRILTVPADDDKTSKAQRLPIPEFVWQVLEHRSKLPRRITNEYVFPSDDSDGFIQEPKRAIGKVVSKSGVKFSMHTLRRTFATTASRLDIAYYKLKALLNHSVEADVTGRNYVQVDPEQLREPMQEICDYLRQCCGAEKPFKDQIQSVS